MNAVEFGRLVAALRRELRDEAGRPCTQAALAQRAGLSPAIIGKLERGEKIPTDPTALPSLAHAFHLSIRERREFFFAALDVDQQLLQPALSLETALNTLLEVLRQLSIPAFIVNSYDDIIAANALILRLFPFSAELQRQASRQVGGYNVMRFVFSSQSQFGNWLGQGQQAYLNQSIAFFRAISLPVRGDPYFQRLMKAFRADPAMNAFVASYDSSPQQENFFFESLRFSLKHPALGSLAFFSPPVYPAPTARGSFYLIPYLPADGETLQRCAQLASQTPPDVLRLPFA